MKGSLTAPPMMKVDQPLRAMLLTAMAVHGLLAAPLAHAEEHAREAEEDAAGTEAVKWAAEKSGDPVDALAYALEHVHALGHRGAPATHHHEHGAPGGGQHGQGTLVHFAFALHAIAPPPPRIAPPPLPSLRVHLKEQRHTLVRYLVPERSQAPPRLVSQPNRSADPPASSRRPPCILQSRPAAARSSSLSLPLFS